MRQPDHPFKIAFLLSGSGSTLENLLNHISSGWVKGNVNIVISSREGAFGLERARNWGIDSEVVSYKSLKHDLQTYSDKITSVLQRYQPDLVVLGGFMSPYLVPEIYRNKVINIHPALIPAFSGKGFYGEKVFQKILEYGTKVAGCTVHFVDQGYDTGPIISQRFTAVYEEDNVESLQQRVQQLEREAYPSAIQAIIDGRVRVEGRKVFVQPLL